MKKNSTDSRKAHAMLTVSRVLVYALLIFLSVLCLFSFYMLIVNASRTNADLQGGFKALPQGHFLENLKNAWNDSSINIPRGMLNSFIIAAILSTYFSALTAYGLHAYNFKLKRLAFLFIMAVMVIPKQVSAAGFVQLCYKLKLTNSYLPLILPGIAAPVVFFYMIQYMKSVLPMEIVEAARVDGSGEFFTFNRIVLPMLKPAVSVQLIFTFVESWNNYFLPALLLGVAFANLFMGIPIDGNGVYHGNIIKLLNPYGLAGGIFFVLIFCMHGALWLALKSEGDIHERAVGAAQVVWPLVLAVALLFLALTAFYTNLYANYAEHPTLLIFPILAVASLLTVRVMIWADNLLGAWFFSALFIITVTFFGVLGMYPGIIISSIDPAYSVTVFNGASSQLTLKIMLGVTLCCIPVVIAYQAWVYYTFAHKVTPESLQKDDHAY